MKSALGARARWILLGMAGVTLTVGLCWGVSLWVRQGGPTIRTRALPLPRASSVLLRVAQAELATTTMDLERSSELLEGLAGPEVSRARARLALYRADCEGAIEHLSTAASLAAKGARELRDFAERCAGATVGGKVIVDEARGIWLRLQDQKDEVLAPLIFDVAHLAREMIAKDVGTTLPKPLRIDLVRDLFSLSAVSGLPLEAAETTGTVAVARWGRITIISPRAISRGYPWQDTMAHEITHLVLSRASADVAPLWLQEGVAKREETRWRERRAFDDLDEPDRVARAAERSGSSVGIDRLGPSIAMLPSADQARIAFAEVTSFIGYFLRMSGEPALGALLRELRVVGEPDRALRGVTGWGLVEWQQAWRADLETRELPEEDGDLKEGGGVGLYRAMRLSELLYVHEKYEEASEVAALALDRAPANAALRFEAARAARQVRGADVPDLLGTLRDVGSAHAGHLALLAAQEKSSSNLGAQALGLDPFLIEVACLGTAPDLLRPGARLDLTSAQLTPLCAHVRELPFRGSE